tara:strand:- start:359 stop:547 length:189 start_codon:yes stop_codon:yes gene_type:complete
MIDLLLALERLESAADANLRLGDVFWETSLVTNCTMARHSEAESSCDESQREPYCFAAESQT